MNWRLGGIYALIFVIILVPIVMWRRSRKSR